MLFCLASLLFQIVSAAALAGGTAGGGGFSSPQVHRDPEIASAVSARCGNGNNVSDCISNETARIQTERRLVGEQRIAANASGAEPGARAGGAATPGGEPASAAKPGPASFNHATEVDAAAQGESLERAAEAEKGAEQERFTAKYQRAFADELADNFDRLNSFVQPRQASTDPRLRSEAASRLREPAQFQERFRELAGNVGLRTNQDVQSRAPAYVNALGDDSERHDKLARKLDLDAAQARMAARRLGEFREKLDRRVTNMNTLAPGGEASALTGGDDKFLVNGKAGAEFGKGPKHNSSSITARSEEQLKSGGADNAVNRGAGRGLASSGKPVGGAGADGKADPAAAANGKQLKAESLRDALRRKLAAAGKHGEEREGRESSAEGTPVASSYSQFFEDAMGVDGKPLVGGAKARQSDFFLSGPETDQVVAKFVGSISSEQGSDERVFGNSDVNIFHRMTAFIRKAESEKRILR